MSMAMSPEQQAAMAKAREVTKEIKCVIDIDYDIKRLMVTFTTDNEKAAGMTGSLLQSLAQQLATQMQSFFGIQGEFVEHGTGPA